MNIHVERRLWIEASHKQEADFKKLLEVILRLAKVQEKASIVRAFGEATEQDAVEIQDCIVFANIALRFDGQGKLVDVFKVVEGTTNRAEIVIEEVHGP